MLLHLLIKLEGVEVCGALHPDIERVSRDGIELFVRSQQIVTRIVEMHFHLWVLDDGVIFFTEVCADHARHQRFDLSDGLAFDLGVDTDGAGGHPRAATNDQHIFGMLHQQRGHVTQHALQTHIIGTTGGLNLAGVVVVAHAGVHLRDRQRSVAPFSDKDEVTVALQPSDSPTTIAGQKTGHRLHKC